MSDLKVTKRRGRPPRAPVAAPLSADDLAEKGRRSNTDMAYRVGLRHYFETHGGRLPATVPDLQIYLETYQATLSISTLRQRLWAISKYHREAGHPDPTASPSIGETLAGIAEEYAKAPKKARPLTRRDLVRVIGALDAELKAIAAEPDSCARLYRPLRDRALILVGFWLGLRSDELARLRIEGITLDHLDGGRRLTIYLPSTKTTKAGNSEPWYLHELPTLCPVNAYLDWVGHALLKKGPLFLGIDAGHNVNETRLHTGSITGILRRALSRAGLEGDTYSSHSLRRGLATCWYQAGGTFETLIHHVKWRSPMTAIGYQAEVRSLPNEMVEKWGKPELTEAAATRAVEHFLSAFDAVDDAD